MKTVVAFSAGTDSVAALVDSINKYGKENVIAYMIVISTDKGRLVNWQAAQEFYGRKICEELGVQLVVNKKYMVSGSHTVSPDIYEWAYCLIMYCLGNHEVERAVYGHSSDDRTHKHVILWWDIFDMCMKAQERNVTMEHPLSGISKRDCYNMIPESIRKYIWTCITPTSIIKGKNDVVKGYVPCGKCGKCTEFSSKVY